MFYRRYVEAWVTEINLQAMRGTEHMGERDSIGYLLFGANRVDRPAERAEFKKAIRSAADAEW